MDDRTQIAAVDVDLKGAEAPAELVLERYQMQLSDAITGEVLGYGGGQTPEEAAERAIEDARVSGELEEPLETNDEGVRD